jgi:hypothetical protein
LKNLAADQRPDDPTLRSDDPTMGKILSEVQGKNLNEQIHLNQKVGIDAKSLLQPKICQATTQIYRSIQNKLLGLEKRDELKVNKRQVI